MARNLGFHTHGIELDCNLVVPHLASATLTETKEPTHLTVSENVHQASAQTPTKATSVETGAASSAEVEQLRLRLEAQQVDWTLSRADNQFLQEQLEERDKLINELAEGLKGIEENQTALEEDNRAFTEEMETLRAELQTSYRANRDLEQQVQRLKKVRAKEVPASIVAKWLPRIITSTIAFCIFAVAGINISRSGNRRVKGVES